MFEQWIVNISNEQGIVLKVFMHPCNKIKLNFEYQGFWILSLKLKSQIFWVKLTKQSNNYKKFYILIIEWIINIFYKIIFWKTLLI